MVSMEGSDEFEVVEASEGDGGACCGAGDTGSDEMTIGSCEGTVGAGVSKRS